LQVEKALIYLKLHFIILNGTLSDNMNYQKRIIVDPKIMIGKPVIKGTRIAVELILKLLAQRVTIDELISQKYYPHLQKSDVYAAIEYAKELVSEERVYPLIK
jgi:uncharacterized protein (DUF433 family)